MDLPVAVSDFPSLQQSNQKLPCTSLHQDAAMTTWAASPATEGLKATGDHGSNPPFVGETSKSQKSQKQSEPPLVTYASKLGANTYFRMDLTFVKPEIREGKPVVKLPFSVVSAGVEKWKFAVVGYVLGINPSYKEMEGYVRNRWANLGKIDIYRLQSGVFIFNLSSEEDKINILEQGPWSFSRRPFILRQWEPGMNVDRKAVETLPIWVKLPGLPLECYTPECLSLITSHLGKPLFADRQTSELQRISYARVCVEIGVEDKQYDELPIEYAEGKTHFQKLEYEWLPHKCETCCRFGHSTTQCSARKVYVEKPKELPTEVNITPEEAIPIKESDPKRKAVMTEPIPRNIDIAKSILMPGERSKVFELHEEDNIVSEVLDTPTVSRVVGSEARATGNKFEALAETKGPEEDVSETEEDTKSLIADDGNLNARGNQPLETRVHSDSEGYNTVRQRRQTKRYSPPLIRGKRDRKAINNKNEAKLNDNDEVPEVVEKNDPNVIAVSECTYELIVAACKRKGIPPWPRKVYEKSIARLRKEGVNMLNIY